MLSILFIKNFLKCIFTINMSRNLRLHSYPIAMFLERLRAAGICIHGVDGSKLCKR